MTDAAADKPQHPVDILLLPRAARGRQRHLARDCRGAADETAYVSPRGRTAKRAGHSRLI